MEKATRKNLAKVAEKAAQVPFHGYIEGKESNLEPIIRFFPQWTLKEANGLWCAAFVYYCCREAGFGIPIRPEACKTCHLAGCIAWEELAAGDPRITYHKGGEGFVPDAGDIVLYDRVLKIRNMIISVLSLKTGEIRSLSRKEILPTDQGSSSAPKMSISEVISESRMDTNIGG